MKTVPQRSATARQLDAKSVFHGQSSAKLPDALRNFDSLPDAGFVRLPVVAALFACSPATVWRRVKAKSLPEPRKLSEKVTAWRVGDLRKALRGEAWQ